MITLYMDKFRGFTTTTIPFADVNFLVGENSTGKSSVLALVHLLSSPDFWFSQNFNLSEYEFGGFTDILSAGRKRSDEFSFGLALSLKHSKTKEKKGYAYLVSYREKDALPTVSLFARVDADKLLAFRQFKNTYRYRTETIRSDRHPKNEKDVFAFLSGQAELAMDEFSELPENMPARAGFFPLLAMLESLTEHGSVDEHRLLFPLPLLGGDMAWLAPIRTRPKRTYDGYGQPFSPEGEHTPYLLRKKLDSRSGTQQFRKALSTFGAESGLFSEVIVHELGEDAASPFELMIKLRDDCALRINSVGYGVSQVLPLVVEMLARSKNSWFAIQQPEVHLHPRAQAALGDLIFQLAENDGKRFLLETHSDFTVDRFRANFRSQPVHKTSGQLLYFERTGSGNVIHRIPIERNGEYGKDQPPGFRSFFLKEQINLLGL